MAAEDAGLAEAAAAPTTVAPLLSAAADASDVASVASPAALSEADDDDEEESVETGSEAELERVVLAREVGARVCVHVEVAVA